MPAPEGIVGRNLLPLLADVSAKVRDRLPLFNFWGAPTAQSLAIVTPEWNYIHWYSASGGMTPTDELFHLRDDRIEMKNLADDPNFADQLATMQKTYDSELGAITSKLVTGHGYESYPKLFDRALLRDQKALLIAKTKGAGANAGGSAKKGDDAKKKRRKASE